MSVSGYIELTRSDEEKILICVDSIATITQMGNMCYVGLESATDYVRVKESYDEIKNRLLHIIGGRVIPKSN